MMYFIHFESIVTSDTRQQGAGKGWGIFSKCAADGDRTTFGYRGSRYNIYHYLLRSVYGWSKGAGYGRQFIPGSHDHAYLVLRGSYL